MVVLAVAASSTSAQVKAAFGGAQRAGGTTPMQRSFAMPRSSSGMGSSGMGSGPAMSPAIARTWSGGGAAVVGGTVVDSSALYVNGSYTNNNLSVDFHLGANPGLENCRVLWPNNGCNYYPYYGYYGGWGWYNNYYDGYYDNSDQHYSVIDGALVQPIFVQLPAAAAQAPQEPPPPPTDDQIAASLLMSGDAQGAVEKYRVYLRDNAGDAAAMRALAIALVVSGEPEQGVAMMSMAYRTDPTLADKSIPDHQLFRSDADLRLALQKSVTFANKMKSASSWLTVAVLMQAEGRKDHALRMIDRAEGLGLDAALVKRFKTALGS